jgi:polyphosphate kinase
VQIELQARFDEANNISYASKCKLRVNLFWVKGTKGAAKCVIERIENGKVKDTAFISTGNFNEATAKVYTDVTLFTSHHRS